jgi:hypothetical protein
MGDDTQASKRAGALQHCHKAADLHAVGRVGLCNGINASAKAGVRAILLAAARLAAQVDEPAQLIRWLRSLMSMSPCSGMAS